MLKVENKNARIYENSKVLQKIISDRKKEIKFRGYIKLPSKLLFPSQLNTTVHVQVYPSNLKQTKSEDHCTAQSYHLTLV